MPDDMLEDAIQVSKTILDEHEFESNGVEVSFIIFYFAATNLIFNFYRSLRKLKHIWIKNGSHHGTYSLVNLSVAMQFTRKTDSSISLLNIIKFPSSYIRHRD